MLADKAPDPEGRPPSRRFFLSCLVLLVVVQAFHTHAGMAATPVITSGDPCWYYAVARNWAEHGGLTDNVLWTFLGHPTTVERAAGTYWVMGWPFALGLAMQVLGHGPRDAMTITAALSTLVPVLVFALVWYVLRDGWAALLAGLLECLQVRLLVINVIPDVTVSYQVTLLLLSLALVRMLRTPSAPWAFALGVLLSLPAYLRLDGPMIMTAGLLAVLLWTPGDVRRRLLLGAVVVGGLVIGLVPYLVYYWSHFGCLVPEARQVAPFMTDYSDFWRYPSPVSVDRFVSMGLPWAVSGSVRSVIQHLRLLFVELPPGLAAVALVGLALGLRARMPGARIVGLFLLFLLASGFLVPRVANPQRFLAHVLPFLCALAGPTLLALARRSPAKGLVTAGLLAACVIPVPSWIGPAITPEAVPAYLEGHLSGGSYVADPSLHPRFTAEDVVLAEQSFRVSAYMDVATLQAACPEQDVLASIVTYKPRYAVVVKGSWLDHCLGLIRPFPFRVIGQEGDVVWYEATYVPRTAQGSIQELPPLEKRR